MSNKITKKLTSKGKIIRGRTLEEYQRETCLLACELIKYMKCVEFIHNETNNKTLKNRFSKKLLYKDLASVNSNLRITYLKNKLYEMLIHTTFTERPSVLFAKNNQSKILRSIWETHR